MPGKSKTMDMTSGVIWKQLVVFSLPLLAGNIFQTFYNTVDSLVVGNYVGAHALGAVTSVSSAIFMMVGFFSGLATGAGVVISQLFGAGRIADMRRAVHTSILTTLLIGLAMTALSLSLTPWLLRMMNTPPEIYPLAVTYLRIYFSGIPALTFYNMGAAILRAVGDSTRPLYFLIASSLTNILLDIILVARFNMGVAGVGNATVASEIFSCILLLAVLLRTDECYRVRPAELTIDRVLLRRIFSIGMPTAIQMALISFSNVFVQSYINSFGAGATSGWGVYSRLDSFVNLPRQSFNQAVTTFVGQNAGAGNRERIRKGISTSIWILSVITILLSMLIGLFAPQFIHLFNSEEGVLYYGTLIIRLLMPFEIVCVFNQIHAGALRGMGKSRIPMVIMISSFVLFRQIYLAVISRLVPGSIEAVALGYPVGWLVCSVVMFLYYRSLKKKWQTALPDLGI